MNLKNISKQIKDSQRSPSRRYRVRDYRTYKVRLTSKDEERIQDIIDDLRFDGDTFGETIEREMKLKGHKFKVTFKSECDEELSDIEGEGVDINVWNFYMNGESITEEFYMEAGDNPYYDVVDALYDYLNKDNSVVQDRRRPSRRVLIRDSSSISELIQSRMSSEGLSSDDFLVILGDESTGEEDYFGKGPKSLIKLIEQKGTDLWNESFPEAIKQGSTSANLNISLKDTDEWTVCWEWRTHQFPNFFTYGNNAWSKNPNIPVKTIEALQQEGKSVQFTTLSDEAIFEDVFPDRSSSWEEAYNSAVDEVMSRREKSWSDKTTYRN